MKQKRITYLRVAWAIAGLAGILALTWFIGTRVLIYVAAGAVLIVVICAVRKIVSRNRRHDQGRVEQASDHQSGNLNRGDHEGAVKEQAARKVQRNDPCPCESGEKYKRCCGME